MAEDLCELRADPALVEAWLRARSVSRGLPQPEPDSSGLRVETGSDAELRRWVFAEAGEGLGAVAERVREPRVGLRLCATAEMLRSLVPTRWEVQPQNVMMTRRSRRSADPSPLPEGLRLEVAMEGPVAVARVLTREGEVAARGRAAAWDGVMIYDQISTEAAWRRRGLGRAVMAALEEAMAAGADIQMLAATSDGRALYSTIGFELHSAYSAAVIPPGQANGPPSRALRTLSPHG
jgi:GNAT superfamily N-acetyltransferase